MNKQQDEISKWREEHTWGCMQCGCDNINETITCCFCNTEKPAAISLDAKRFGYTTTRVVVANNVYLNKRVRRYCPVCEETTLQDPKNTDKPMFKCCQCDFVNKDTDLGMVVFAGQWRKW